mmetsp:Transcript_13089/g.26878  ORF Transcript_13089/g.26878 Transcript_13089/m.26878 type:complete len:293 (-) Transcript_13089:143-1021(-)
MASGAKDAPLTSFLRTLYRFWPIAFMAFCIGAVVFLPIVEERGVVVAPTDADTVQAFLTSPPLLIAMTATALGLRWSMSLGHVMTDTEFMAMVWHLSNGTWWSLGCDSWSGLFRIMPRMRKMYLILDTKHGVNWDDQTVDRPWNPEQATLESVYWAETTVHVPLSLLAFYLYATRNRNRYLVEAFVGGAQLVGSYGYYGPELLAYLHGFPTTWPDNWVIFMLGIGCVPLVWCTLPCCLTLRAMLMQMEVNSSFEGAAKATEKKASAKSETKSTQSPRKLRSRSRSRGSSKRT